MRGKGRLNGLKCGGRCCGGAEKLDQDYSLRVARLSSARRFCRCVFALWLTNNCSQSHRINQLSDLWFMQHWLLSVSALSQLNRHLRRSTDRWVSCRHCVPQACVLLLFLDLFCFKYFKFCLFACCLPTRASSTHIFYWALCCVSVLWWTLWSSPVQTSQRQLTTNNN